MATFVDRNNRSKPIYLHSHVDPLQSNNTSSKFDSKRLKTTKISFGKEMLVRDPNMLSIECISTKAPEAAMGWKDYTDFHVFMWMSWLRIVVDMLWMYTFANHMWNVFSKGFCSRRFTADKPHTENIIWRSFIPI